MPEQPIPRWQKIGAVLWLVLGVVFLSLWGSRIWGDLWPIDRSPVGPNLIASYLLFSLAAIAGALLYPPIRRAIHRFLDKKLHQTNKDLHQKLDRLHELQVHIIHHHPDIPTDILRPGERTSNGSE